MEIETNYDYDNYLPKEYNRAHSDLKNENEQLKSRVRSSANVIGAVNQILSNPPTQEINPLMVKVSYSERDKDGKERKGEITIDTRDTEKKSEKEDSKSEDKKDTEKRK